MLRAPLSLKLCAVLYHREYSYSLIFTSVSVWYTCTREVQSSDSAASARVSITTFSIAHLPVGSVNSFLKKMFIPSISDSGSDFYREQVNRWIRATTGYALSTFSGVCLTPLRMRKDAAVTSWYWRTGPSLLLSLLAAPGPSNAATVSEPPSSWLIVLELLLLFLSMMLSLRLELNLPWQRLAAAVCARNCAHSMTSKYVQQYVAWRLNVAWRNNINYNKNQPKQLISTQGSCRPCTCFMIASNFRLFSVKACLSAANSVWSFSRAAC